MICLVSLPFKVVRTTHLTRAWTQAEVLNTFSGLYLLLCDLTRQLHHALWKAMLKSTALFTFAPSGSCGTAEPWAHSGGVHHLVTLEWTKWNIFLWWLSSLAECRPAKADNAMESFTLGLLPLTEFSMWVWKQINSAQVVLSRQHDKVTVSQMSLCPIIMSNSTKGPDTRGKHASFLVFLSMSICFHEQ